MAAVTPISVSPGYVGEASVVRSATAQANTGQTDWIEVPAGASSVSIFCELTAVAGTTPIVTPSLKGLGLAADDALAIAPLGTALTGTLTAAPTQFSVSVAPSGTEQVAIGTAKCLVVYPVLPPLLGITLTLDRTTGNETYTYVLSVRFA
jgi:hypothetical protein